MTAAMKRAASSDTAPFSAARPRAGSRSVTKSTPTLASCRKVDGSARKKAVMTDSWTRSTVPGTEMPAPRRRTMSAMTASTAIPSSAMPATANQREDTSTKWTKAFKAPPRYFRARLAVSLRSSS